MLKSLANYYMDIAKMSSSRSSCLRRKVGAVAIKHDRIMATGRNGQVPGSTHCRTCLRDELQIPSGKDINTCRAIHAEQNMLVQAAIFGISLVNSSIYCTHKPCFTCMKLLLSLKPSIIVWAEDYPCENTDRHIEDEKLLLAQPTETLPYFALFPEYPVSKPLVTLMKGA